MNYAKIAYSKACDIEKYLNASAEQAELFPFQAQSISKNFIHAYCLESYDGLLCAFTGEVGESVTTISQLCITCTTMTTFQIDIYCNNIKCKTQQWTLAQGGGGILLQNVFTLAVQQNTIRLVITSSAPFTLVGLETTIIGKCVATTQNLEPQAISYTDTDCMVAVHESDQVFFYTTPLEECALNLEEFTKKMSFLKTKFIILQNTLYFYGLTMQGDLYRVRYEDTQDMVLLTQNVTMFDACTFYDVGQTLGCVLYVQNDTPFFMKDALLTAAYATQQIPITKQGITDVCIFGGGETLYFLVVSESEGFVCIGVQEEGFTITSQAKAHLECYWRANEYESS